MPKPQLFIQTTTWWDYPSQHHSKSLEKLKGYVGATPSYIIWNLLKRYTRKKDLVVDPMCGSGTTIDVAHSLGRRALGYDLKPVRDDIFRADARKLPLEPEKADFVFIDPPYSNHIKYSGLPQCLGELSAQTDSYSEALHDVIREIDRILRPERYMALYISDSFKKGKPIMPLGFRAFSMLCEFFIPVDIIAVVRHNAKLKQTNWHQAALEQNFFLRGFNYLFIMYKTGTNDKGGKFKDRRDHNEIKEHLQPVNKQKN